MGLMYESDVIIVCYYSPDHLITGTSIYQNINFLYILHKVANNNKTIKVVIILENHIDVTVGIGTSHCAG